MPLASALLHWLFDICSFLTSLSAVSFYFADCHLNGTTGDDAAGGTCWRAPEQGWGQADLCSSSSPAWSWSLKDNVPHKESVPHKENLILLHLGCTVRSILFFGECTPELLLFAAASGAAMSHALWSSQSKTQPFQLRLFSSIFYLFKERRH